MHDVIDKHGVLGELGRNGPVVLELGCGNRKRYPRTIGIDLVDLPCVDLVGDVCTTLAMFPKQSVNSVYAYHVLEHVDDLDGLLRQVGRVLKPGGLFDVVAPHFSNSHFYSDPTHKRFFGLYTFSYYADEEIFSRKVPHYWLTIPFVIRSVNLRFKSSPPFYVRHGIRRLIGMIVDSCGYLREFYEENISGIVSCYEVHYVLQKKGGDWPDRP